VKDVIQSGCLSKGFNRGEKGERAVREGAHRAQKKLKRGEKRQQQEPCQPPFLSNRGSSTTEGEKPDRLRRETEGRYVKTRVSDEIRRLWKRGGVEIVSVSIAAQEKEERGTR